MDLTRLTERIWIFPYEEWRDRPTLGYIRGNNWSLAVDAGHSSGHTEAFYKALEKEGLPLPSLTVLTHWHWDHTFGMHAIHGLSLANNRTDDHIRSCREWITREGREAFLSQDFKIRNEYADDRPVIVTSSDMVYTGEMLLEAGDCPVKIFQAESPHTDDSTLIFIPGEKVLFLGDSAYGAFPTWESDPELCRKLIDTIMPLDADICIPSHHDPLTKSEAVRNLQEAL